MQLHGRAALVTGAGRRVGRAIAVGLGGRGMRVAVHFHGSQAGAVETARLVSQAGGDAVLVRADLSDPDAPHGLATDAAQRLGGLDVLVNSAAVMERTPFGGTSAAAWDRIFAINLRAPYLLAQAAAPWLTAAPAGGAIVNVADLAAFETWPNYIPHGISKLGVVRLTESLARVLAPAVRVNAVAPGTVLLPEGWTDADAGHLRDTTPLGRHGTPDDVVQAVLYLLDADFVTGETIVVDGGRRVRR